MMSTSTTRCAWEDEMARKRTFHLPSYAEAKKMKSLTLCTHGLRDCFSSYSLRPVASRCLELFVRHTSLLYPLGEAGKLRLTTDYAQMELAISPICGKLTDLGRSYRLVRAIRLLLPSLVLIIIALALSVCLATWTSAGVSLGEQSFKICHWD